jgi:hypothetical protein
MVTGAGLYQGLDMVCGDGNGVVWDCGTQGYFQMEGGVMNGFIKGMITGAGIMLALVLVIAVLWFFHNRDRQIYEYM